MTRNIVLFCIPAQGHTNPTLPVVKALCDMGHRVTYYSFEPFRAQIEAAGATFISCDRFDAGPMDASGAAVARDIVAAAWIPWPTGDGCSRKSLDSKLCRPPPPSRSTAIPPGS